MYVKVRRCVSRLAFKMSSREVLRGFNRMATCTRISATSEAKAFGVRSSSSDSARATSDPLARLAKMVETR
jgi:hypothetical protein